MLTVLRNNQRRHVQQGNQELWHSFFAQDHRGPISDGISSLLAFDEMKLSPGESTGSTPEEESETITYVYQGSLSQKDSTGTSGVIEAGEFQHLSTGVGIECKETSVSRSDGVHLFRISLLPSQVGIERAHELKRFTAAQRKNLLCAIASQDGRKGSLCIHQDAVVYSAILESGHHLMHELAPSRNAWLYIVLGTVIVHDLVLTQGDGICFVNEPLVSLTAKGPTELLLIDVGLASPSPWKTMTGHTCHTEPQGPVTPEVFLERKNHPQTSILHHLHGEEPEVDPIGEIDPSILLVLIQGHGLMTVVCPKRAHEHLEG